MKSSNKITSKECCKGCEMGERCFRCLKRYCYGDCLPKETKVRISCKCNEEEKPTAILNTSVHANYLSVEGGHCFVCHKNWKGNDHNSPECVEKIIKSPEKIVYCGKFKGKECEFLPQESQKEDVSKLTCKHGTFTTYGWGDKMECSECRPQESHKESWEEEFHRKFITGGNPEFPIDRYWKQDEDDVKHYLEIKSFISKLLKEARHSLILELEEKVEGMKKEIYCQFPCSTCREPRAYNSALQEVLQVIRELK